MPIRLATQLARRDLGLAAGTATLKQSHEISPSLMLNAFTVLRLALVPAIAVSLVVSPLVTAAALAVFVTADIYDGVLARQLSSDSVQRRALDSIVDRIAIDSCLVAAYVSGALPAWMLAGFLARDAYCTAICWAMVKRRRAVIKADWVHRSLNLSFATGAVVGPFVSADTRLAMALALLVAAVIVAVDLTRCVAAVIAAPDNVDGCVVPAASARRALS